MQTHTLRLRPGQDLIDSINAFVNQHHIQAGCILCGVGSLTQVTLRLSNQFHHDQFQGRFEIVSITGTVSVNGPHLHIAISDEQGRTLGGHLVAGCTIFTTAEIVLAVFPEIVYQREPDPETGYNELVVYPLPA